MKKGDIAMITSVQDRNNIFLKGHKKGDIAMITIPYGFDFIEISEKDIRKVQKATLLNKLNTNDIRLVDAILSYFILNSIYR